MTPQDTQLTITQHPMIAQFIEFETINDQDLQAAGGGIVAVPEKVGHLDVDHIKK